MTKPTSVPSPINKEGEIRQHYAQQFGDKALINFSRTFQNYLGGTLRLVDIDVDGARKQRYSLSSNKGDFWFDTIEDVLQWSNGQGIPSRFRDLDFGSTITGVIAIVVVLTIGWWAIAIRADPPGYLGTALTTILGFYFGRSSRA